MSRRKIPELDFREWTNPDTRAIFVEKMGEALKDIGFFALGGHGIPLDLINSAYSISGDFFSLPEDSKVRYERTEIQRQRGFIPFGVEHAKNNPAPDLKEFWQTGRTLSEDHPKHDEFPLNVWPDDILPDFRNTIDNLYKQMELLKLK